MPHKTIIKRQEKEKQLLLENLKRVPIIEVACNKSGIGRTTFYRWKKEDKEFAMIAEEALREGYSLVNDMAESQIISAIKDGNLTAVMYWLNHRNNAYRNKVELTAESKDEPESLTTEQQAIVKKVLALTGIAKEEEGDQS